MNVGLSIEANDLDALESSLQAQRRVTIPFVKEVLERSENL